jgi:hypothetical protein
MRKKSGGSKENTFDPTALPKEDARRRAGLAEGAGKDTKLKEVAELAIKDCCVNYEEDPENG